MEQSVSYCQPTPFPSLSSRRSQRTKYDFYIPFITFDQSDIDNTYYHLVIWENNPLPLNERVQGRCLANCFVLQLLHNQCPDRSVVVIVVFVQSKRTRTTRIDYSRFEKT